MSDIVFTFTAHSENSIIASNRITSYVADHLQLPITTAKNIEERLDGKIETLYIVNGAFAFCKCLEELAVLIAKAKRIVWIQNDYTIIPPIPTGDATSPFRKSFRENYKKVAFFSTCEEWAKKGNGSAYVNWNQLTFDLLYDKRKIAKRRKDANNDVFYYGSFRRNREKYFDRYFNSPVVKTAVSCPNSSFEKYKNISHMGPIRENFFEELGSHGLGLYLEDRQSHAHFHSPANRFYEMLSAGLPIVFQPECGTMMRKAGFNPEPYTVSSAREISARMAGREEIGAEQREEWVRDFRQELNEQFDRALAGL